MPVAFIFPLRLHSTRFENGVMGAYSNLSDNELIQLLNESDHAAYCEIYKRYFHLLFVHAYKKLRDEEQAKDVIQDLFATLWFKRESVSADTLARYLFTAVRNRVFDLFAHQQVEAKYMLSLKDYLDTHSADELVRENDLKVYIEKQIAALPPRMKRMFDMSRQENLSHKEIAATLGTTENNVSTQITTALRILRTKLGIIAFFCCLLASK